MNVCMLTVDEGGWQALSHMQAPVYLVSAVEPIGRMDVAKMPVPGLFTASHATESVYEAVVKVLVLQDDVEVDSKDDNGCSFLSHTTGSGHEEVVRLLEVLHRTMSSWTPRTSMTIHHCLMPPNMGVRKAPCHIGQC